MDELKKLLKDMQQEIRQSKSEMLEMKEELKSTIINSLSEKFANLETKQNLIETKIEQQNSMIKNFDRYMRRKNLILFGVEEQEKSYHELEKNVIDLINTHFNLQYNKCSIEEVRRLGKKRETIRPIKITFTTLGLKINLLKKKKLLDKTPYYVKEDFSIEMLNKRKDLQEQLKKEHELGHKAYIRYDKLIIKKDGEHQPLPGHSNLKKRSLSESPEIICNIRNKDKKQSSKKNRLTNMKDFIIHKPKFNYSPITNSQDLPASNTQNNGK